MTSVFIRRENLGKDTHTGGTACGDENRDGVTYLQAKENHRLPTNPRSWEKHGTVSPSQLSEGTNPADT